jgi:hypothetical protein
MRIAHHGPHGTTVVEAYGPEYGHADDLFEELYETLKRKETTMKLHWPWFRHHPTGEVKQFESPPDDPDWKAHVAPPQHILDAAEAERRPITYGSGTLPHAMRPLEGGGLDIRKFDKPEREDEDAGPSLGMTLAVEETVLATEEIQPDPAPDPEPDFSGGGGDGGGGGASDSWSDSGSSSADT